LTEGVNRARGEAQEALHHLYIAQLKGYITTAVCCHYRDEYMECVRMLDGIERTVENHVPASDRRWPSLNCEP